MDEPVVPFEVLDRLRELNTGQFGQDTCFDYVDSLIEEAGQFGVVLFIEPLGNVTKFADSWTEAIDWWIAVLKQQLPDWDYILAGSHLMTLQEEGKLPDDPGEVWKLRCKGMRYGEPTQNLMTINIQMKGRALSTGEEAGGAG